jgi:hypothetical protein
MQDSLHTFDLGRGGVLWQAGALAVHALSAEPFALAPDAAYWVLVTEGEVCAELGAARFALHAEHYLATPGEGRLRGGRAFVIEQRGYRNVRQLGGPLEATGRLRYVDGCTDTLLVCPPRLGEPCLNHLHIPPHTRQSAHTHPTLRLGVIARGRGACHTPRGEVSLEQGLGWLIPVGLTHSFSTSEQALDVFAWHPDSDFGPTDADHPMLNRTLLQR